MEKSFLRLRVYNTSGHGVMMSLFDASSFKIMEAMFTEQSLKSLKEEMDFAGCSAIDSMSISSWNDMYCSEKTLGQLLKITQPTEIELPAASPESDNCIKCKKIINVFCNDSLFAEKFEAGPKSLIKPTDFNDKEYSDVILGPLDKYSEQGSNSIVKLYWTGRFTVLNTSMCKINYVQADLEKLLGERTLDVLIVYSTMGKNDFLKLDFLNRFNPAAILEVGENITFYQNKDGSMKNRGINSLHLSSGDIVLYSGFYKKTSNLLESGETIGTTEKYVKLNETIK